MAFTLKVLDNNASQYELQRVLNVARQSILDEAKKRKTNGALEDLSQKLTKLYYPTEGSPAIDYATQFSIGAEETLTKVFKEFNFENNKSGSFYTPSQKMWFQTLKKAVSMQENIINKLTLMLSSKTNSAELNKILTEAKDIFTQGATLKDLVEQEYTSTEGVVLTGDVFLKARKIVNAIKGLSIVVNSDTLTLSQLGNEFEKSLAKINLMKEAENIVDELMLESQHKGPQMVSRGNGGFVSYTIDTSIDDPSIAKENGFKIQAGNATFTYNPFEKKQGKMDVQLYFENSLGDGLDAFRISAKRWTKEYGSFGTTSIDAGITRSSDITKFGGQTVAEAYKLALLPPSSDQRGTPNASVYSSQSAHSFAKTALKADIIMGLSQREGYANVLVVDTGAQIIVKDIPSLIEKESLKIENYNTTSIDGLALAKYRILGSQPINRTASYLGLMTSTLNKMKVSINTKVSEI